jgi:hypothetical protein
MTDRIGAQTTVLETSHSAFLSEPEPLGDTIDTILRQSST